VERTVGHLGLLQRQPVMRHRRVHVGPTFAPAPHPGPCAEGDAEVGVQAGAVGCAFGAMQYPGREFLDRSGEIDAVLAPLVPAQQSTPRRSGEGS
jgi:hypothetical protein